MKKILISLTDKRWKVFLIYLFLVWVAHGINLRSQFKALDDKYSIVKNEDIKTFSSIPKIFSRSFFGEGAYYRPLVNVSFMLEYKLFGLKAKYFQLTNLLLHLFSAYFVFLIIANLTRNKIMAFWVGLIFSVHPIHWEAVANISGRAIVLNTLFFLMSFWFYIYYAREKSKWFYYVISVLAFVLSLLSKETAVTLPIILCFFELYFTKGLKQESGPRYLRPVTFFILLAVYAIIRRQLNITNIVYWDNLSQVVLGVMTFARGCITYLRLVIFPVDLYFDRAIAFFSSFRDIELWFTVTFFIWLGILLFKYRELLKPSTKFFLLWTIITLAPVFQVFPISAYQNHASLAEHFVYLPSIGIFSALVFGITILIDKAIEYKLAQKGLLYFALTLYCLSLVIISFSQNLYGISEIAMLKRSLEFDPDNSRIRISYGLALAEANLFREAEDEFRRVLKEYPNDPKVKINLAKTLTDQGKLFEGVAIYEEIVDPGRLTVLLNENLKLTYEAIIRRYKDRLKDDLDNPQLYYSLGVFLSKLGRVDEAVVEYEKALVINPYDKNTIFNLASCYDYLGNKEMAIKYFEQMVSYKYEKDKYDLIAYQKLAEIFTKLKDEKKKEFYNQKVQELATILEK